MTASVANLAPGIDVLWNALSGYDEATAARMMAVADNPCIVLHTRAEKSGTVTLTGTGDNSFFHTETAQVVVE